MLMKPQDILFFVIFALIIFARKPVILVWAGLGGLVMTIPLFAFHIFFTAERLSWYAAAFFTTYVLISLIRPHTVQ